MKMHRVAVVAAMVLVAASMGVLAGPAALAAESSGGCPTPAGVPVVEDFKEFFTGGGHFYTLDDAEAATVALPRPVGYGFTKKPDAEAAGLKGYSSGGDGLIAIHRLEQVGGNNNYLVTAQQSEIDALARPDSPYGQFTDDGIIGYGFAEPCGDSLELHRYSLNGDSRVGPADRQDLLDAGFEDDGIVAFLPRG
ncbi:hypothetical protein [Pseudonocardia sp. TRM90224]|uniref:hypothetical protein n=1 Tax=Pseudonocardia sp. TRM90224 TaxID=2812678 RepID=UPI001E3B0EC6|nr:hypothetical protein [Pseudonocardia sp. TRM90224]